MICNVCSSGDTRELISIEDIPVFCNVLLDSYEEAVKAPKGNISLCYCNNCGHIFNATFDAALMEYDQQYENSLHFSKVFQDYAENLVNYLIEKYDVREKRIIDIGCGKGDFLKIICDFGKNKGFGFDKSYVPKHNSENITFVQDFYTNKYSGYKADLVLCRQVLEHIEHPNEFLKSFESAIRSKNSAVVFFEVPNAMYTIEKMGIWDLIYEHCSYYTERSLSHIFDKNNYKILELKEQFNGQYLSIELSPENEKIKQELPKKPDQMLIDNFKQSYTDKIEYWKNKFTDFKSDNKTVVVWSAGSKGVTFLNLMDKEKYVEYIVDVSPQKQKMFVPVSGQKVVSPEFLKELEPDVVILMNSIYETEIKNMLAEIGIYPETISA